jgi:hypothetical protein
MDDQGQTAVAACDSNRLSSAQSEDRVGTPKGTAGVSLFLTTSPCVTGRKTSE